MNLSASRWKTVYDLENDREVLYYSFYLEFGMNNNYKNNHLPLKIAMVCTRLEKNDGFTNFNKYDSIIYDDFAEISSNEIKINLENIKEDQYGGLEYFRKLYPINQMWNIIQKRENVINLSMVNEHESPKYLNFKKID